MQNLIPVIGKIKNKITFEYRKQPNMTRVWPATSKKNNSRKGNGQKGMVFKAPDQVWC